MGWLLPWKRKEREPPAPEVPPEATPRLATNAPADWPDVPAVALEPETPAEAARALLTLRVAATLQEGFEKGLGTWSLARLNDARLVEGGVLSFQVLVKDPINRAVPVLVYPEADAAAGARFAGARQACAGLGLQPPVYYAPAPLPAADPVDPVEPFGPWSLQRAEDAPVADYAMWWATPGNASFADSETARHVDRAFRALDGYEPVMLGALAANLGLREDNQPVALPEEITVAVEGPDEELLLMTASAEKGIRFHFDPARTSPAWRDLFWRHFADACERMARDAEAAGLARERPEDPSPLRWWTFARETTRKMQGELTHFGLVIHQPASQ